jgi:uncharacterized membrane protein YjjP (DUF1212 family)
MSIGIAISKTIHDEQVDDREIEKQIKLEMVEDEMHRLVELKSMRVGLVIAGIGFVGSLVLLVLGYSMVAVLNVLFIAFAGGSLLEGISQLYFYRRGVVHG